MHVHVTLEFLHGGEADKGGSHDSNKRADVGTPRVEVAAHGGIGDLNLTEDEEIMSRQDQHVSIAKPMRQILISFCIIVL